jgi:hypothetical protein
VIDLGTTGGSAAVDTSTIANNLLACKSQIVHELQTSRDVKVPGENNDCSCDGYTYCYCAVDAYIDKPLSLCC